MVTKEEALTANTFHYTGRHACRRAVGPRGGIIEHITTARRNGATKTWKTAAERFRVPVKWKFYEYGEITQENANEWHTAENCPLNKP